MALSSRERRCALRKIAEDAKITDSELQDRIIANIEADERWFLADLKGVHRGDEALNEFIDRLLQIYREAGKKPGLSRHWETRKPGGPTLRYVRACLELVKGDNPNLAHLIRNLSDKALASRIQRAKKPENPYRPK
jgi:hypothetical protein